MWYSEYLLGLRENTRELFQTDWRDKIAVGDIVLISTKNRPRILWLMGKVMQLLHGDDGRSAKSFWKPVLEGWRGMNQCWKDGEV